MIPVVSLNHGIFILTAVLTRLGVGELSVNLFARGQTD